MICSCLNPQGSWRSTGLGVTSPRFSILGTLATTDSLFWIICPKGPHEAQIWKMEGCWGLREPLSGLGCGPDRRQVR